MKKSLLRAFLLIMAVLCMMSCNLVAIAVEPDSSQIQPYYTGFHDIEVTLNIYENDMASCYGATNIAGGYTGDITMILQSSQDGSIWTDVKTWEKSGSRLLTLDKLYFVARGYQYRVKVIVHSYDTNENIVDTGIGLSDVVPHY